MLTRTSLSAWPAAVMSILLTSLLPVCTAEVTVEAENKMVVLPESSDRLDTLAMLACYIQPQVSNVRWITPDETSALSIHRNGQYIVNQGDLATISGIMKYGSILLIQDISYRNAGRYVCEVMDEDDCSDFPKFATVELVLKMTLAVASSEVRVVSGAQSVELQCEASGYIRPESDIRWFVDDKEIVEGEKYNVLFREGRPNSAQIGNNETSHSLISVLTISTVEEADVGTYSCQSMETGEMASLHLIVETDHGVNASTTAIVHQPTTTPSATPPSPSTGIPMDSSNTSSNKSCSVSIATAVICTFVLTASLAVVIACIIAYFWFKVRHSGRRIKSGISSTDLGSSSHPATSHTDVREQVDMYRISTGDQDDIDGSGGDSAGDPSTSSQ